MTPTDYSPVPAIVDALLEEGLPASADRVRARLGSGSNQKIQLLINARLRELGRLPQEDQEAMPRRPALAPAYRLPEPNRERVQFHLDRLRGETDVLVAMDHLRIMMAAYHATLPRLDGAANGLYRRGRLIGEDFGALRGGGAFRQRGQEGAEMAEAMLRQFERIHRRLQVAEQAQNGGSHDG
jgi:hypothetical protein